MWHYMALKFSQSIQILPVLNVPKHVNPKMQSVDTILDQKIKCGVLCHLLRTAAQSVSVPPLM
jgi:hypothetical protein